MKFSRLRTVLTAIAVAPLIASGLVVPGSPAPAAADVSAVVVAGSFQSELGCDGDWQADCAATALVDADGDGVHTVTLTVPAGEHEFKLVADQNWDTAFGANDAPGENANLVLGADTELVFSFDGATQRVGVATAVPLTPSGTDVPGDVDLAQPAVRQGAVENFYFVMTDRFANADAANDTGGIPGDALEHGFDPTNEGFYHGGDLAGLREQLDYIEGLGTTAIWLTPSFTNAPVQGAGDDVSAGYHGYWITDFTQIDPHLGSNAELEALIDDAHARGIKVYFDIITNHTADGIAYAEDQYSYVPTATDPYRDAAGEVIDIAALAGAKDWPELDAATSFPYTPVRRDDVTMTPAWLNDVTLYHNRGDSTWTGESVTLGDFVGLDDLMTEHPDVVEGMIDIYTAWIDLGIDGFRIDTVKHVNFEFWEEWTSAVSAHADAVNPDFFMFGEVYDADPALLAPYVRRTEMDATLDFAYQSAAANFARGFSTQGLASLFAGDDLYLTDTTSAATLPTFLGNHDMGRIGYFVAASDQPEERAVLAHELLYLTRGQPVVYYGDEQGLAGSGGDKAARQSLFASQVDAYTTQPLLNGEPVGSVDRYDTDSVLYSAIADLAELREAHPALADGAQIELHATSGAGVYAFSRVHRDELVEYVVAVNNATTAQTVELTTLTPSATYTPVHGGDGTATASADGVVTVSVPALSAVVLQADRPVAPADGTIALQLADGGKLSGDTAAIAAAVTDGRWAETTFALRPLGGDWSVIGVAEDDTPRVFADVSDAPRGTPLEVRAVGRDAAGTLAGDSALVFVGQDLALTATAGEEPSGDLVTVPGGHNAAMGCAGDWQPDCAAAALELDTASGLWTGVFDGIPAGTYEWKVAVGGSWDENYGVDGVPGGSNLSYTADGSPLRFFHDPDTRLSWVTHTSDMVTLPGDWQAALGCPGDWQPECLATAMRPLGDGTWTFTTDALPTGTYQTKAAVGGSWDENYGVGGVFDGPNYEFSTSAGEVVTVTYDETTHVLTIDVANPPLAGTGQFWAQWLTPEVIAWPRTLVPGDLTGLTFALAPGDAPEIPLALAGDLPADLVARHPHLASYVALEVPAADAARAAELVTGGLLVTATGDEPRASTGVQLAGVLDALYADALADVELGPVWSDGVPTVRLWAPTATDVSLLRWGVDGAGDPEVLPAERTDDGTWAVTGDASWRDAQYLWRLDVHVPRLGETVTNEVTDPYSVGLTLNSERSVLVDLDDPSLAPEQWADTPAPSVRNDASRTIWELHVRDFSIADESVPAAHRGTYKAFTHADSAGMRHLAALEEAGVDTVHLLPTFDIATIQEDRALQVTPDVPDAGPDSEAQQAAVTAVADADAFNWGYDPYHYSTPEGSYATDAGQTGGARTVEFREMVGALHASGLQVVLDKVYNHTAASGQAERSVLDQVVPGYYHRLSASGAVETSTCCENIATEHRAAEKLMVDSVVTWARQYRVDGFRFDLMGHHSRGTMEAVRAALDELTLESDGVDGAAVYLYGEGWDFGEVTGNARFTQAIQGQLSGTGIGAFNDRLRDAVRGGGPFDEDQRTHQGFGTGLFSDPNGVSDATPEQQLANLRHQTDLVRLGMAGNLADFTFTASDGTTKRGDQLDYNGQPAGYASEPQESVNYVDAHDNETLFDNGIFKLPADAGMDERLRMNAVSLATVALGQSPSFWHAGTEILRSKSLDRDSYNSGDHFNAVDWTLETNVFGTGLPGAEKNADKWPVMAPLLADPGNKPDTAAMTESLDLSLDLLRLRKSTPLLTLGTADLVKERVTFPGAGADQVPGLLLMAVDDRTDAFDVDVDEALDGVLVAINATPETITVEVPELAGRSFALSEVQAAGSDDVVRATAWVDGTLTIPPRTAALLVEPARQVPEPTPTVTATPTPTPTPVPTAPTLPGDLYSTPGYHHVNGRQWFTTCEPYSQTIRCRTTIWATQVRQVDGAFQQVTDWHVNSMTYLPFMTRAQWAGNPLGHTGQWTAADGRRWRTECDTAATGRGGCRSYAWSSFITSGLDAGGTRTFRWTQGWVVNNIVRFR